MASCCGLRGVPNQVFRALGLGKPYPHQTSEQVMLWHIHGTSTASTGGWVPRIVCGHRVPTVTVPNHRHIVAAQAAARAHPCVPQSFDQSCHMVCEGPAAIDVWFVSLDCLNQLQHVRRFVWMPVDAEVSTRPQLATVCWLKLSHPTESMMMRSMPPL